MKAQTSNGFYTKSKVERQYQTGESEKNWNSHFKMQSKFIEPVSAAPHIKPSKHSTVTSNLSINSISTTIPYSSYISKANAVKGTEENRGMLTSVMTYLI